MAGGGRDGTKHGGGWADRSTCSKNVENRCNFFVDQSSNVVSTSAGKNMIGNIFLVKCRKCPERCKICFLYPVIYIKYYL